MKKMILLLTLLIAACPAVAYNLVVNSDFDDGTANWANWGDGYGVWAPGEIWIGWSDTSTIGQDTGHLIQSVRTYTMTAVVKTIDQPGGQAEGVTLILQYYDEDTGWTDIVRETTLFPAEWNFGEGTNEESPWTPYSISFDASDYPQAVGKKLLIAIAVSDTQGWDDYGNLFLDSVDLIVDGAEDPIPADDPAFENPLARAATTQLSWLNPDTVDKCDLYFGDITNGDANMLNYTTNLTKYEITSPTLPPDRQTWTLPALTANNQYAWAVDCYRGTGLSEPNLPALFVWKFTVTDAPLFDGHPADQLVDVGGTAEFTASFTSIDGAQVTWFKEAGENDIRLSANDPNITITPNYVGVNYETTLSIANVDVSREGQYYCEAKNAVAKNSQLANLAVRQLMAYWPLDGSYTDASNNGRTADPNGAPAFSGGIKNSGVQVDVQNGWATAGTWDPSGLSGQLTVSLWVKWDGAASGNQAIISKADNWQNPDVRWEIACTSDGGVFALGGGSNVGLPAGTLKVGEWQFIAFTFDGTDGTMYSVSADDAGLEFPSDTGSFALGDNTDAIVWLGARGTLVGVDPDIEILPAEFFTGMMDEVKVFNYAKDLHAVVDLYNESDTKRFCIDPYAGGYADLDSDGNCEITLVDFAAFAKNWLECGLYPNCP